MCDANLIAAGSRQGQLQRVGDVVGPHGRTQLPGDDVAREVIENGGQIEPSPADHLEVGAVGLPELVGGDGSWALSKR